MSWIFLLLSGCFEIVMILLFRQIAQGKGKALFGWILLACLVGGCSFGALSYAMKEIDMSIAYAVWTGIGTSGGIILSSLLYKERITWIRAVFLFLIIGSMVGLKALS